MRKVVIAIGVRICPIIEEKNADETWKGDCFQDRVSYLQIQGK